MYMFAVFTRSLIFEKVLVSYIHIMSLLMTLKVIKSNFSSNTDYYSISHTILKYGYVFMNVMGLENVNFVIMKLPNRIFCVYDHNLYGKYGNSYH